jgi:hypothetical protein
MHRPADSASVRRSEATQTSDSHVAETVPEPGAPASHQLEPDVLASLEHSFGHALDRIRIHAGPEAELSARAHDAKAFALGDDLYFRQDTYDPRSLEGRRLLSHEIAHAIQQSGSDRAESTPPAARRDARLEADADVAASHAALGLPARVSSQADVSVACEGADEDKSIWDTLNDAGKWIGDTQGSVVSGIGGALGTASDAYNSVAPDFKKANADLGSLVDMGEASVAAGNQKLIDQAGDDPILSTLAKGSAWMSNTTTQLTGGVVKGAGDLTSMAGNAIFHPFDAAKDMLGGVWGLGEHLNPIPGMGTAMKGIHGLYDLAAGTEKPKYGSSLSELGTNLLDPKKASDDQLDFLAGFGGGTKAWSDKPAEAAARTVTNLIPMLLGAEGALGEGPAVARGGPPRAPVRGGPVVEPPVPGVEPPPSARPGLPGEPVPGVEPPGPGGGGRVPGTRNPVQMWKNIGKPGPGNVEIWQNILEKGASAAAEGGGVASTIVDMVSPMAQSVRPFSPVATLVDLVSPLAESVRRPLAPTIDMPAPVTPVMPGAPTVPGLPFAPTVPGLPFAPTLPELPFAPTVPELPFAPTTPALPFAPTVPDLPFAPTVPDLPLSPTMPGMPTFPGIGPGRLPTLPGFELPDLPPFTEPGMPTMPGIGPGRLPTLPGVAPLGPSLLPEILPELLPERPTLPSIYSPFEGVDWRNWIE